MIVAVAKEDVVEDSCSDQGSSDKDAYVVGHIEAGEKGVTLC